MAFKTNRSIKTLLYSSKDLDYDSYKVYTGGEIDGEETNGLYTKINSYSGGDETSYSSVSSKTKTQTSTTNIEDILFKALIAEIGMLLALIVIVKYKNIHS